MNSKKVESMRACLILPIFGAALLASAPVSAGTAALSMADSIPIDYALRFDGKDDVVDIGDLGALSKAPALTIEMWVRVDSFSAWRTFFAKRVNDYNRVQLQEYLTPGDIGVAVSDGKILGYYHTTGGPVSVGSWIHLAMVFDGSRTGNAERLKLLINGAEVPLVPHRGEGVPSQAPGNAAPVLLGAEKSDGAYGFTGAMDDLRIWTLARSPAEIIRDMGNSALDPKAPGLAHAYDFEDRSGTGLSDRFAQGNGGLRNFALEGDASNWFVRKYAARGIVAPAAPEAMAAMAFDQVTGLRCVNTRETEATLVWSPGGGDGRAIFVSADTAAPLPLPANIMPLNPDARFGAGGAVGVWHCVKSGAGPDSLIISGLEPGHPYVAAALEFRRTGDTLSWRALPAMGTRAWFNTRMRSIPAAVAVSPVPPVAMRESRRNKGPLYLAGAAAAVTAGIVGGILYFGDRDGAAAAPKGHDLGIPPGIPGGN